MDDNRTIEDYLNKFPADVANYYRNVIAGKELISVKKDTAFKLLFDPDRHKDRVSEFISLVLGFPVAVIGSLKTENTPRTGVSKKSILDILAITDTGMYIIIEIQILSQNLDKTCYPNKSVIRANFKNRINKAA